MTHDPLLRVDHGYENHLEIVSDAGGLLVRKTFLRKERFVAEAAACALAQEASVCPPLRSVNEKELSLLREWAPGLPIELHNADPTLVEGQLESLAETIRRLHQCTAPGWGPVEQTSPLGWVGYLRDRLELRLAQARPALAAEDRLRAWALSRMERIKVPPMPALLHHDLKPANILLAGDRIALVDLEHAKGGDPLSDLAKLKWRTLRFDDRLWQIFLKAYVGATPDSSIEQTVEFYVGMHCLGSVAYGVCTQSSAYAAHVASANAVLARLLASGE